MNLKMACGCRSSYTKFPSWLNFATNFITSHKKENMTQVSHKTFKFIAIDAHVACRYILVNMGFHLAPLWQQKICSDIHVKLANFEIMMMKLSKALSLLLPSRHFVYVVVDVEKSFKDFPRDIFIEIIFVKCVNESFVSCFEISFDLHSHHGNQNENKTFLKEPLDANFRPDARGKNEELRRHRKFDVHQ